MVAILGLSCAFAWFAHFFPPQYLGLLGIVPIIIGGKRLYDVFLCSKEDQFKVPQLPMSSQVLIVALADVAHGPDTIILFSALLADSDLGGRAALTATYLVLVVFWCFWGWYIFNHPRVGEAMQKFGHKLAPFAMIAIGVYILLNTARDIAP